MHAGYHPIISLRNVTYRYPTAARPALREFSLDVEEGEFLLVTGASGSGKSTLLRLLNGLVPHFYGGELSGGIEVAGRNPVEVGPGEMSDSVGLVFQDPEAQFVAEMVEDEMAFGLENAGLPLAAMRKRIEEALNAVGIEHLRGRRVNTLSGGERQRVAIASVLTLHPRVLVLDEPTSQLDPQSAEEVLDTLVKLNKDLGLTVILSEHRLERVVQHADRILYLQEGSPPLAGEPRRVLAEIPLAPPLAQVGKLLGWSPLPLTIKEGRKLATAWLTEAILDQPETSKIQNPGALWATKILTMRDVSFGYGSRPVLQGVGLQMRAGEITAIMGRNGTGKTTLLKLIMGLLKPSRGRVETLGKDTRSTSIEEISRLVAYVPQQPDVLLFADTVQAELDFTRRAHHLPPDGAELLAALGLTRYRDSDPRDLSVGERQRVALAAVLASGPSLLLLDEPTRGLDYLQKEALTTLLRGLRDAGRAVVLATHDVELAAHLADRVILLGDGDIVADGPAREVMSGSLVFSSQVSKLFRHPALVTVEDVVRWNVLTF
jgi:energy-coupling factor transport system ATP-binding protein